MGQERDKLSPSRLKYTEDHVWVRIHGDLATIGMSRFAQSELGDIVFAELLEVGDIIKHAQRFATVESVKTVTELNSPISGKVVEVNQALSDSPGKINEDPYGEGWMITVQLSDSDELDKLWSAQQYIDTYGSE